MREVCLLVFFNCSKGGSIGCLNWRRAPMCSTEDPKAAASASCDVMIMTGPVTSSVSTLSPSGETSQQSTYRHTVPRFSVQFRLDMRLSTPARIEELTRSHGTTSSAWGARVDYREQPAFVEVSGTPHVLITACLHHQTPERFGWQ